MFRKLVSVLHSIKLMQILIKVGYPLFAAYFRKTKIRSLLFAALAP